MLCTCGAKNIFGAKVCKACGTSLETKPNSTNVTQPNEFPNQSLTTIAPQQVEETALLNVQYESPAKSASSELEFIPYTSNIQFNYFIKGLRNSFDFNGRATQSEFWYFVLFEILTLLVIGIFSATLYTLAALIMSIPATAVMVRRMHDIGRSWKWLLWVLVPPAGLVVIYWLTQPSETNANAWGPMPLES